MPLLQALRDEAGVCVIQKYEIARFFILEL